MNRNIVRVVYTLDAFGIVVGWNPLAEQMTGYTAEEILGKHRSLLVVDGGDTLQQACSSGFVEREEWRFRKDGTRFLAQTWVQTVQTSSGEVGFVETIRDVTETLFTEENRKELYFLLQDLSNSAVYTLDGGGLITSWNRCAERIEGYCSSEILGRHFSIFWQDVEFARSLLDRTSSCGISYDGWQLRKDGTFFWGSLLVEPIFSKETVVGYTVLLRDTTKNRERILEDAHQSLESLSSGVAHHFNNILMAISGNLELLGRRSCGNASQTPFIQNALVAVGRGMRITQDLLSFTGDQRLNIVPVQVSKLVFALEDRWKSMLGEEIMLKIHVAPDGTEVLADVHQLEVALTHLLTNARNSMEHGEVVIRAIQAQKNGRSFVCVSVEDNGFGMDSQTLLHAVDPFYTTGAFAGKTGLGLSMVHGMSVQLGGDFVLKSHPGEGTVAEIWLPVSTDDV